MVPHLVGRFLKEWVPPRGANTLKLEGPKVQLSREASRAGPPHAVPCGLGVCRSHLLQFPGLLMKGVKLWGGTGLLGDKRLIQEKVPES